MTLTRFSRVTIELVLETKLERRKTGRRQKDKSTNLIGIHIAWKDIHERAALVYIVTLQFSAGCISLTFEEF